MPLQFFTQNHQHARIRFLSRYVAYHFYRTEKDWVVKTGIKFGTDFGNLDYPIHS